MKVSIVIPNYNGKQSLAKNLPQVLATGADEVIVVDDASTDGSVEEIKNVKSKMKNDKEKLKIIENERNLGFSSTVNRGVKTASGEIAVLLNIDVLPELDFLAPLVSHFSEPQVFAVGCLDKSPEDGKVVLRGRGVGKFEKGFLIHSRGEVDKTDTLWVAGGSGAFRKDTWETLGGLDEIYNPFYWEDIDLSYRAQKAGFKILFEPKSKVVHQHGEGIIKKNFSPFYIRVISYRNQFFFVWKNITDIGFILSHVLWLPYHLVRTLLSFDFAFWIGFFLAVLKLPRVILNHRWTTKLFTKTDRETLSQFQ